MTGKQSAVLWLGLLLVIVRLFTTKQWSDLWGAFGSSNSNSSATLPKGSGFGPGGHLVPGELGPWGTEPL
jgi:hypothetical protein